MPSTNRRAAARRKVWGRGPMILRFEPLEKRQLLTDGVSPVSAAAASGARPDLVITAFDTFHNLDHGEVFNAVGVVENFGNAAAPVGLEIDVFASPTPTLGANAVFVGTATLDEALEVGGKVTFREPMSAPPIQIPGLGTSGTYYFVAKVDPANKIPELNESNNGGSSLDPASLVTITPKALPILSPGTLAVSPGALNWGQSFTVSGQLPNHSGEVVPAGRARVVIAAEGQAIDGGNSVTIGEVTIPAVGVSQVTPISVTITLPARPPGILAGRTDFTVSLIADAGPLDAYLGGAKLQVAPGVPLGHSSKPDLSVVSLQPLDTQLSWSMPFQVRATVANDGKVDSGPMRLTFSLIDANRPDLPPLAVSDAVLPGLGAGFQQEVLQTIQLAGKLPQALDLATVDGRIVVSVDPENAIDEADETNNALVSSGPVTLKLLTREGLLEPPKAGPVTTRSAPADPTPTPAPPADPPAQPRQPTRPQRPTREQLAERMQVRRAMLQLRTEQYRLGLRVLRDQGQRPSAPHFNIPENQSPKAS